MRLYAVLFAIGLAVYGALAWDRLGKPVGGAAVRLSRPTRGCTATSIVQPVTTDDDWAKVETVVLADGREVSGPPA